MMTYLGWQTARKIARVANYACSLRLYAASGSPWRAITRS